MRFFILLNLSFAATVASAMPHASLRQLTHKSDANCDETSSNNGMGDLIHEVNLVAKQGQTSWEDPRGVISVMGPKVGMSKEEIQQARKTTGYVVCPGSAHNNGAVSSAALIGQGGQLVTNVHAFIDEDTGLRREPLSQCFFQNQADPKDIVFLDFRDNAYKFFTNSPQAEFYKDVAIVRLTRKISGAQPFKADFNGSPMEQGQEMIMISANQERMPSLPAKAVEMVLIGGKKIPFSYNREPIVQKCTAVSVYPATNVYPTSIYSDCSETDGASGSIDLVRVAGQLVIKGVHRTGGPESADHKPFNTAKATPDKDKSYSYAIGLDSLIGNEITTFEEANDNTHTASGESPHGF